MKHSYSVRIKNILKQHWDVDSGFGMEYWNNKLANKRRQVKWASLSCYEIHNESELRNRCHNAEQQIRQELPELQSVNAYLAVCQNHRGPYYAMKVEFTDPSQ